MSGAGYILFLNDIVDVRRMVKRDSHGSRLNLHEDVPTLKAPFRMSGSTFSIMMWVRVHRSPEMGSYNLLRVVG